MLKLMEGKFRKRSFGADNSADLALATSDNFDTSGESTMEDSTEGFSLSMALPSTSSRNHSFNGKEDINPLQGPDSNHIDFTNHSWNHSCIATEDYLSSAMDGNPGKKGPLIG